MESTAEAADEQEEGEIEDGEIHPMVTVTKIDPKDIPEVSNQFLMRANKKAVISDQSDDVDKHEREKKRRDRDGDNKRKYGFVIFFSCIYNI